ASRICLSGSKLPSAWLGHLLCPGMPGAPVPALYQANARAMQTAALNKKDKFAKRFVYYLAAFWSVVATVYLMCITFVQIPEASVRFADTILGFVLGTVIASIIGFFFGSSAVTNEQHEQMNARDSPAFK
ncbi:hypothetical protein, partial [Parasutterella excrementihominis]|uniref:hypothetical protein n=1 Tax=Parasutterella excrementihominis TaxID=487175 RepID=UPI0019D5C30C